MSAAADAKADVVVVGAGGAGLPAAISALDAGASVIVVESNNDVGGHAILSAGAVRLGGGTALQRAHGIADSPDLIFLDLTDHRDPQLRISDRDLVRMFADENVATYDFLVANGVRFPDEAPIVLRVGTVPRVAFASLPSDDLRVTINGMGGSGVTRPLEQSARRKGATFLLGHRMTELRRDGAAGRVTGVVAEAGGREVTIGATRGVVIATGGHTSNVSFRRMFDPRLTEEYQVAGEPWSRQDADGELAAMRIGASLWGLSGQTTDSDRAIGGGTAITKTLHIGCRWGYLGLKWDPRSPAFPAARASGLTVRDFQDVILVNQVGERFWDETDESMAFVNACLAPNGNLASEGGANGGGPIWAIFDAAAVAREGWDPRPPNVDEAGWFFSAGSVEELAAHIANPYQRRPISGSALARTVARYNAFVDDARDADFGKPAPRHRIERPPFYAAWSTPILHDSFAGLRIDRRCRVIDTNGRPIPGLYCAGESAGGFTLHGLPRALVFGRVAGREAARGQAGD